jgi:two-component system response regulator AtoC
VAALALHFVKALGPATGRPNATLSTQALALLEQQSWPGNVRQLQNFIERLLVLSATEQLDEAQVRLELARGALEGAPRVAAGESLDARRKDAEREALEDALQKANGNRSLAARLLGVSRRTLYNKLETLGLDA